MSLCRRRLPWLPLLGLAMASGGCLKMEFLGSGHHSPYCKSDLGPVVQLGEAVAGPVAADDESLYFWAESEGALMRLPHRGGSATRLTPPQPDRHPCLPSCAIAVDATAVYFAGGDGTLQRLPRAGGAAVSLASGLGQPRQLFIEAGRAYLSSDRGLLAVPTDGGTATVLSTQDVGALVLEQGRIRILERLRSRDLLAHRPEDPTWRPPQLLELPADGGPASPIGQGADWLRYAPMAADRDTVYVAARRRSELAPWRALLAIDARDGHVREAIALGLDDVAALALDGQNLYFLAGYRLYRRARAGGPIALVAETRCQYNALAISRSEAFLSGSSCPSLKVATHAEIAQVVFTQQQVQKLLAGDAEHLYYLSENQPFRLPLASGAPVGLAQPSPDFNAGLSGFTDDAFLYFGTLAGLFRLPKAGGEPLQLRQGQSEIVSDGEAIYVATGAQVLRLPKSGGAPVVLANSRALVLGVAVDATNVYWTEGARLMSVKKQGGPAIELSEQPELAGSLVVHSGQLYFLTRVRREPQPSSGGVKSVWVDSSGDRPGSLRAVSVEGGRTQTVAPSLWNPWGLAPGASHLYFADFTGPVLAVPTVRGSPVELTCVSSSHPSDVVEHGSRVSWADGAQGAFFSAPVPR